MRCTQFLRQTLERYRRDGIEPYDPDYIWEEAHTPTPRCLGGNVTVPLIREDHFVHDLYQAEDYQRYTFFGGVVKKWLYGDGFLCENWFELVAIYDKWATARSKSVGTALHAAKRGIFSPEIDAKRSELSKKGGIATRDARKAIFSPLAKAKSLMTNSKMVELIGPDGEVYVFESARYAAKILNLDPGNLKSVCRGEYRHHRGFTARYLEPDRY